MQTQFAADVRHFVISTFLFDQGDGLSDDDSFLDRGIIDSTGVLELISWLEESYQIQVGDGDLLPENFDSISRVARYLDRKLNGGREAELCASAALPDDRHAVETLAEAND